MSRSVVVVALGACSLIASPSWCICDPQKPGTSYVQIEIEGGPPIEGDLTVEIASQGPKEARRAGDNIWRTSGFDAPFDYRNHEPQIEEIDLDIVKIEDLNRSRDEFEEKCYAIYAFTLERKAWKLHVFGNPPGALLLRHRYSKKDPFPESSLPLDKGHYGTLPVNGFPGPVDIRIDSRTERGPLHLFTLKKRKANRWWHRTKPTGSLDEISEETIERLAREEREKNPCRKYPEWDPFRHYARCLDPDAGLLEHLDKKIDEAISQQYGDVPAVEIELDEIHLCSEHCRDALERQVGE